MNTTRYRYTSYARRRATELRRDMTPPERHLWYDYLRGCPWKFQRQKSIGPYIVDFVCYEARLILELDGDSHNGAEAYENDERRTNYLANENFRILRLTNRDVQNHFADVCQLIAQAVNDPHIHGRISSDSLQEFKE